MAYDSLIQDPSFIVQVFLLNLIATIVFYGAIPMVFALTRKKTITKRKYRIICFALNFVVLLIISFASGNVSSGFPYVLWTTVFTALGVKKLNKSGLIVEANDSDTEEEKTKESEINTTGTTDEESDVLVLAEDAGEKIIKEEIITSDFTLNEIHSVENNRTKAMPPIRFCRHCGVKIAPNAEFCHRCGTKVVHVEQEE